MGPRRVGKTVLLHHVIQHLLNGGRYDPRDIGFVSLDQPLYTRMSLEDVAQELREASGGAHMPRMLFIDEIQYLADWERHLKAFVDAHPEVRCVASGSAAAALRLKSVESGAGRFTDFLLPPLTFHEYLDLQDKSDLVEYGAGASIEIAHEDIAELNGHFVDYINFGGYPEAALSSTVRSDIARYIGADIVEKVLLRDLPSLYGIRDVQELNALFTTLAFNTASELSLEGLSQDSGVSKPTLKRYLEYLEAAFLIKVVHRIDHNARRFKRATRFKVYVTTPALRSALFGPVTEDDEAMGALAETAVFAQWFHASVDLHYARWRTGQMEGEVDIVHLDKRQRPVWCLDVKWSDRPGQHPEELTSLAEFAKRPPRGEGGRHHPNPVAALVAMARTRLAVTCLLPTGGLYCCALGRDVIRDPTSAAIRMRPALSLRGTHAGHRAPGPVASDRVRHWFAGFRQVQSLVPGCTACAVHPTGRRTADPQCVETLSPSGISGDLLGRFDGGS